MLAPTHTRHTLLSLTLMNAALLATNAHAQEAGGGSQDHLFWGKIAWLLAMVAAGVAIWFFKVRRKAVPNDGDMAGGERHDRGA